MNNSLKRNKDTSHNNWRFGENCTEREVQPTMKMKMNEF